MTPLAKLQEKLRGADVDALLVSNLDNIGWLTGFKGSFAFAIVRRDEARFITDSRYAIMAKETVSSMPVVTFGSPKTGLDAVSEAAKEFEVSSLGFEAEHVTVATLKRWQDRLPGIDLKPFEDPFGGFRMIKTPDEIEKIRAACKLADAAFAHVLPLVRAGVTELQIHLEIEFFFKKQGADISFTPIVVSGAKSALPHGRASDKLIEHGDYVTMDFGALLDGYCSDLTRTVVVGKASERHREIYAQVLKAQLAAIDAIKPGANACDVDKISRDVLAEKDLAQYFGHGLGHGLGRVVHDPGALNATSTAKIAKGQVWTVEPGVYIPDFGGVRIEDDVVVTDQGVEILTSSPKELLELG